MPTVSPSIVSRFLVSAGKALEKKEKQNHAKKEIKTHLERVKKLAEETNRPELQSAIQALEEKLEKLIELDEEILLREKKQSSSFSALKKKLDMIDEKIESYYEIEKSRDERIERAQKQTESRLQKNRKEIELLEKKISDLEAM
ncbi:hypothetical protein D6764_03885, partial [Candidatus Woesearchaeota archaeon]